MDALLDIADTPALYDVRSHSHDGWKRLVAQVYASGAQPAYVDRDGRICAERIRPVSIVVTRAEGPAHLCGRPLTAYDYAMTNHMILAPAQRTAPTDGSYPKHDFLVTFADGLAYTGRYDLTAEGRPSLEGHIAGHMGYVLANAAELALAAGEDAAEVAADARGFLDRYEVGQPARALEVAADDLAEGRVVIMRNYRAEGAAREPQI